MFIKISWIDIINSGNIAEGTRLIENDKTLGLKEKHRKRNSC